MKKLVGFVIALAVATVVFADPIEKTIPVPKRDDDSKIGIVQGKLKIESVTIQNYPDSEQVSKAKNTDPNDKSFVFWNFSISNNGDDPVKVKIEVTLIGKDGESVGKSDKSDTVEANNVDDNLRVMMHPKILDLVNAKEVKLRVTITPKR